MSIYGYARVSTLDQDLALQMEALKAAGAERVFFEKISGAKTNRPELAALLSTLTKGDTLMVTRLDRLARSTLDLLGTLKRVDEIGATFKSLAETLDTGTPVGKLLTTVLGSIAEFERSLILARTSAGRARAKAAGKSIGGPKRKMNDDQVTAARTRLLNGEHPSDIAPDFGVSAGTIKRLQKAA